MEPLKLSDDGLERLGAWLEGVNSGQSSEALAWATVRGRVVSKAYPRDPSDLGRCMYMLEALPELKPRIVVMVDAGPEWAALIANWGTLTALLREENAAGDGTPETYTRMKELFEAARGW